jgi:hypothetical protein
MPNCKNSALVFGRTVDRWQYHREVDRALKALGAAGQVHAQQIKDRLDERYRIQRQMQSLAIARRLLAVWHTIHIPIGVALFMVAFIHIGATVYYATLIK